MQGVLTLVIDEKEQSLDWNPDLVTPPKCSSHRASILSVKCSVLTLQPRQRRPRELLRGSGMQRLMCDPRFRIGEHRRIGKCKAYFPQHVNVH